VSLYSVVVLFSFVFEKVRGRECVFVRVCISGYLPPLFFKEATLNSLARARALSLSPFICSPARFLSLSFSLAQTHTQSPTHTLTYIIICNFIQSYIQGRGNRMFRKRTGFDPHTHAYTIICNFIYSCIQGEGIEYFVNEAVSIPRFPIPELHVCYSRPRFTGTQGVCECVHV